MALKAGRVGVNPNYVDKEGRPLYDNSYLKELLRKEGIITLFTKEGNPISIDNAVAGRVYDLVVNMSPKQAGTGDPSPTNIRAISGYDTLKITANSVDTDYSFDNTVYGGVLDVTTGVLTINKIIFDLGDTAWNYDANAIQFYSNLFSDIESTGFGVISVICSCYKISTANYFTDNTPHMRGFTGKRLYIVDPNYTDATAFRSAVSGQKIVYEPAAPTTVQLTAQDIQLLTGANTLSSDAGTTMDLKYLGTLVPGGANGRSLNRSLNFNREVIDGEERKEIQEEIKEEVKEVPVEEPVTVKKSTKKSTK